MKRFFLLLGFIGASLFASAQVVVTPSGGSNPPVAYLGQVATRCVQPRNNLRDVSLCTLCKRSDSEPHIGNAQL
jgi:hypothetical protein